VNVAVHFVAQLILGHAATVTGVEVALLNDQREFFAVNDMDSTMRVECETYCLGRAKKMATATSTPRMEKAVVILIRLQALSRFLESVISVGIYHDLV